MFTQLFTALESLPINAIKAKAAESVLTGTVTVIMSDTGSGKTLLLPPALVDASGIRSIVLVPRRSLAVNAAKTVAKLSGLTLGQQVGYAVGAQSGEESLWCPETKAFYCTYGYAIASGLILSGSHINLDEVHEASIDMSIARALLHRRRASGEAVNIMEMSATINASKQASYWTSIAPVNVLEVDGRTFPCERLHRPDLTQEQAVKYLLDRGRKGILAFRPGRKEVEDMAEALQELLGDSVEVAVCYGELDGAARELAMAEPQGKPKVLVTTNVLESGANIPWLDAGVSCGTGKENSVDPETDAVTLRLIDLPRWRLKQQEGRVKRFCDGIFVLCAKKSFEDRQTETTPEILRLPLTGLALRCAGLGIRAGDLTFDYPPAPARITDAELKLQRLGLIDTDCLLTEAGQWVSNLPLSPETGAMLWYARGIGVLAGALPLAAVMEMDGIREDFRVTHGLDFDSDWLDSLKAFQLVAATPLSKQEWALERYNVSLKLFTAARELHHNLQQRLKDEAPSEDASPDQLRQCLVAGLITSLFTGNGTTMTPVIARKRAAYEPGYGVGPDLRSGFALAQLRTIQPKEEGKKPFTIMQNVTDVRWEDILEVAKQRPEILKSSVGRQKVAGNRGQMAEVTKPMLFGEFPLPESQRLVTATQREQQDTTLPETLPTAKTAGQPTRRTSKRPIRELTLKRQRT